MAKFDHRKAGEEADEMIRALNQVGDAAPEHQDGEPEAIVQDNTNADDPGASDPGASSTSTETAESAPPAMEQQAEDPDLAELKAQLAKAEQRYSVLRGMFEKKDEESAELRRLLAGLAEKQQTAAPTPETDQGVAASGPAYTQEDVREFGQPLIDLVERIASSAVRAVQSELSETVSSQVGSLKQSVDSVTEEAYARQVDQFDRRLQELVPDWKRINVDPLFVGDWLTQRDRFSGLTRLELLRSAYESLDADRVAAFFLEYKGDATPETAAPEDSQEMPNPASLVTPGRSKATAAPKQRETGKVWTRADIAKLYDDKMARRISAEEFAKQERDLFKAQSEGRVAAA